MARARQARYRRLLGAGLLCATLVTCGRAAPVEIGMGGLPPAALAPTTAFQGQVASVDAGAGLVVVDVRIIWTPVLTADRHVRTVLVDAGTRWEPAPAPGLAGLKVGDEIQVEAVEAVEGVWPAVLVQLFDVD